MLKRLLFKFYNQWQWTLRIKSVSLWRSRQWQDKLPPERFKQISEYHGSLSVFLRQLYRFFLKRLKRRLKIDKLIKRFYSQSALKQCMQSASTTCLHLRMNIEGVKPVVPVKKYIITLLKIPRSCTAAKECVASARLYEEDNNIEVFPAIDIYQSIEFFKEHGLVWMYPEDNTIPYTRAAMGAFASHFRYGSNAWS